MANQGKVTLKPETVMGGGDNPTNIATNHAVREDMRAMNVDGKTIYPERIFATELQLKTSLTVGTNVVLMDGFIKSIHLAADEAIITKTLQVGDNLITPDKISVPQLSAISANLGSINTGSIAIGSGGVSIGSAAAGIGIMDNKITCVADGNATVTIDGSTGIISAYKFNLVADASSSIDLSQGNHILAESITVGGTTLGDVSDAALAAPRVFRTNVASPTIPTSDKTGDLWFDLYNGKAYIAESAGADEIKSGEWARYQDGDATAALTAAADAQKVADGEIVGFYQNNQPSSGMKFGDIWIDTGAQGFPTTLAIYRYQDTSGGSTGTLGWWSAPDNAIGKVYLNAYSANTAAGDAQSTANSKITTFYASATPSATAVGDLWVKTSEGNKLYRASAIGTGGWVAAQDSGAAAGGTAVQPGGGVGTDANNYITTIDLSSGITITSSGVGPRTNITAGGVRVYNADNEVVTELSHLTGISVTKRTPMDVRPWDSEQIVIRYYKIDHETGEPIIGAAQIYANEYEYDRWGRPNTQIYPATFIDAADGIIIKSGATASYNLSRIELRSNWGPIWLKANKEIILETTGDSDVVITGDPYFPGSQTNPSLLVELLTKMERDVTIGTAEDYANLEVWNQISLRGTDAFMQLAGSGGPKVVANSGSPHGTKTAPKGSICMDFTNGKLWINTNGSTTWVVVGTQT